MKKSVEDAERSGATLGRAFYKVSRKHRERALNNLQLAMPELSHAERERLARRVFEHFGKMSADFVRSSMRTKEELLASIEVHGTERLEQARSNGKGALLISGHFGNWERIGSWVAASGYPMSVVVRTANDEGLDAMVNRLRRQGGVNVIPRGNAARPILECLNRNEFVAILCDQNSDEIFIPFFGKPCGTVLGPGVIHERTQSPVIMGNCIWIAPGKYRASFEPIEATDVDSTVKGESTMRAINIALESEIREHPEQWLWFHDRWRAARKRGLV